MELEVSLPCSEGRATGLCPEPEEPSPYHRILFIKIGKILNHNYY
jgi:hypothetical protein